MANIICMRLESSDEQKYINMKVYLQEQAPYPTFAPMIIQKQIQHCLNLISMFTVPDGR